MNEVVLCAIAVLVLLTVIYAVEMHDRREDKRHRRLLEESIRCKGEVRRVENVGSIGLRSPYPWRVIVDFEFEGERYSVEEKLRKMPFCERGATITVLVDRSDPWKSRAVV